MTTHVIPVVTKPTGRVEWAILGPFLYGIDRAGNVFKLGRAKPPKGAPRLLNRLLNFLTRTP